MEADSIFSSLVLVTLEKRIFATILQPKTKWTHEKRSHEEGDLVMVVDNLTPRGAWHKGVVTAVTRDKTGHVRSASVKISRRNQDGTTVIQRPITKLVLLKKAENLQ